MEQQIKRLIELVKQTNDRLVVLDSDGKNAFVVMNIHAYEQLVGKTDQKMEHISEIMDNEKYWDLSEESLQPSENIANHEAEVIKGIDTEIVNIGEDMSEPISAEENNKYYFEEVDPDLADDEEAVEN